MTVGTSTLTAALDDLYQEEIDLGYIEPIRLLENRWFYFEDPRYDITFQTQINYLRHHYQTDMDQHATAQSLDCPICIENTQIKKNLRVHECTLSDGRDFFMQLTPYPLYKKHFVLISRNHTPMRMDGQSVKDLMDFLNMAPEYTACSNSDVHMAGASILKHHHYQVFDRLSLPIQTANALCHTQSNDSFIELLNYPIASVRITSCDATDLLEKSTTIIKAWKEKRPNNTCNLMLTKIHDAYQLIIIFRHPDFLTPDDIQPVKDEGIGIIEVAGCGIYPVPTGRNAAQIWQRIEHEGLDIITRIIRGNSPIKEENYPDFWQWICDIIPA
jgi:UDPglucose--hexose-1-phosphate uridylyltransferase